MVKRLCAALQEWRERRHRVNEEFGFHVERSAAELELQGWAANAARRQAKARMGGRQHLLAARRELGGDWRGLMDMLVVHEISASPLFQPLVLFLGTLALLMISPSAKTTIESVLGTFLCQADRESVFISRQARNLSFQGVTASDVAAIRSIRGLVSIEAYGGRHVRARLRPGADKATLPAELGKRNDRLRLMPLFDKSPVVMGPARVTWGLLLLLGLYRVRSCFRGKLSLMYLSIGAVSHTVAAQILWAVAVQWWLAVPWNTDGRAALALTLLLFGYAGVCVVQTSWWVKDVESRCPQCFERLRLTMITGAAHNPFLDTATTESICAYGHGSLRRDLWEQRFLAKRHYWQGLTHA